MTVPGNVNRGERATSAWANQLLQALRDEIAARTTTSELAGRNAGSIGELQTERATASRSIADNESRITALENRDDELPDYPADERGELVLRARSDGMYFWDDDNEVPDTPGTSTCLLYTSPSPRDS